MSSTPLHLYSSTENYLSTSDMKAYKASPESYRGNVGDISMFIRIAVTGKMNSPDMYAVMQVLGQDRVINRIDEMLKSL